VEEEEEPKPSLSNALKAD